jgi:hypothetical protein
MEYIRKCPICYEKFTTKREDGIFCSDRCAAQWARDEGYKRQRFHVEKDEWIKKNCAQCNTIFSYNEYAKRTGARVPQYCSNRCRQAAYRERKAAEGRTAGYTGHWDDARNDKASGDTETARAWNTQEQQKNEQESKEKVRNEEHEKHTQSKRNKGTSQSEQNKGTSHGTIDARWKSKDAYVILGVTYLTPMEKIQSAWKKLLRTYHPDISKEPNASEIAKAINWAWDRISNTSPRGKRA